MEYGPSKIIIEGRETGVGVEIYDMEGNIKWDVFPAPGQFMWERVKGMAGGGGRTKAKNAGFILMQVGARNNGN